MSLLNPEQPSAVSHDPSTLDLPSVPRQDIASSLPVQSLLVNQQRNTLLPSITFHNHLAPQHYKPHEPFKQPTPSGDVRTTVEAASASPTEAASVMSLDESVRSTSVSMDDPDVRIAAEALSGLGNSDFLRSPSRKSFLLPQHTNSQPGSVYQPQQPHEPEPLLSLVTSKHPWLGGTINGSLSAYSSTKLYSPRLIRYGADLVERSIGSPMANTAGFVVKKTGVEGGIRWYLGRPPAELEREQSHKRRKMGDADLESGELALTMDTSRRRGSETSFRSLPPYDTNISPPYTERDANGAFDRPADNEADSKPRHWSTQVWISTSGLGAALSEPGLRTLKFCLKYVGRGFQYVRGLAIALKDILDEWEKSHDPSHQRAEPLNSSNESRSMVAESREAEDARIVEKIKSLCDEIWKSLRSVCDTVSQYGGALPENASALVRGQLLSVPLRWRRATSETNPGNSLQEPTDPIARARRMLAFAKEGLDMMIQVSRVIEATVDSAERWLDSMGRKKRAKSESSEDEAPEAKDRKMMNGEHARNTVEEKKG